MASSNSKIKEPQERTFIRFMNAVRKENTEQAVQLLRPHSARDRATFILYTVLLIPSPEKTIRSVIQSEYLNNKSASDEDIEGATELALWIESFRLIYNIVIESSPLLLAKKQGSVDEVRSLLQQLPREEAVRLIIDGTDVESITSCKLTITEYENKLIDDIRGNYTLTGEQWPNILAELSNIIQETIDALSEFKGLCSGLVLTAVRGSPELMELLLEYIKNSNIQQFFIIIADNFDFIGYIIASHSCDQAAVTMTQILLERFPADIKQKACINWLIQCVCGGVCGVEVISLFLKSIKWDKEVKNVIIGLLINTWDFEIDRGIVKALLEIVPHNELGTCLTINFVDEDFCDVIEDFIYKSDGSMLSVARSFGAENFVVSCLSSTQLSAISQYVKSSPNAVTSELLALINPHLTDYCIPDHSQAKLKMHGVVCFNEGQLALERNGAKEEAQTVTEAMQDISINLGNPIKNWSTYSLLTGLQKFCEDIRDKCSLAVVCIMTHGKAGLLYSNTSSSDSCQISDIFNILGERLPQYIPKVIPFYQTYRLMNMDSGRLQRNKFITRE